MVTVGHKRNQSFMIFPLKNIYFDMKAVSKYSLNMNEVDSCHFTAVAENKEHLSITFVFCFSLKIAQSDCNLTYITP